MTHFLNPCKIPWLPTPTDLTIGIAHKYLTPSGRHETGCKHPACVDLRVAWYKQAIGAESESAVFGMATMKPATHGSSWQDKIRSFMSYCATCHTGNALTPLLLSREINGEWLRLWVGPDKKGALTGFVLPCATTLFDSVRQYINKNPTPVVRCVCRRQKFHWPSDVGLCYGYPERVSKHLRPEYWWAHRAVIDRVPTPQRMGGRNLTQDIGTFYVLEALCHEPTLCLLAERGIAAQRIMDELTAVRAGFTDKLAADIHKYLCYAVTSEIRHVSMSMDDWEKTVHQECFLRSRCPSCEWLYRYRDHGTWPSTLKAMEAFPGSAEEFWAYVDHVFNYVRWERGFGGKAWGTISTAGGEFACGANTSAQFVDRAFNLQHNGGLCFDKKAEMVSYGPADVMKLLDIKRSAVGLDGLVPLIRQVPTEYSPLVERTLALLVAQGR